MLRRERWNWSLSIGKDWSADVELVMPEMTLPTLPLLMKVSSRTQLTSELPLLLLSLLPMLLFEVQDEDMADQSIGSVLPLLLLEPMLSR